MKKVDYGREQFRAIALITIGLLLGVLVLGGCEATRGLVNGLGQDINRIVR